jgi:hypothetical protein
VLSLHPPQVGNQPRRLRALCASVCRVHGRCAHAHKPFGDHKGPGDSPVPALKKGSVRTGHWGRLGVAAHKRDQPAQWGGGELPCGAKATP